MDGHPESNVHRPVLVEEALQLLHVQPGQTVVDATVGLGGHAVRIGQVLGPAGRLIAVDRDPESLRRAEALLTVCRVDTVHGNFAGLREILDELSLPTVDAVLADLGVSSPQLDMAERGFSFRQEGPLDMRMDPTQGPTAADLIAQLSESELAWIFWEYGEERFSRPVAKRIVAARRKQTIRTTTQLADLVRDVVPREKSHRRRGGAAMDPATRVFQALRIAVNDELGSLDSFLRALPDCVRPGGRAAILSFHSLEDRRVKQAFRDRGAWDVLTKSPVVASDAEMRMNPRSRSAKLRAAQRRESADGDDSKGR